MVLSQELLKGYILHPSITKSLGRKKTNNVLKTAHSRKLLFPVEILPVLPKTSFYA